MSLYFITGSSDKFSEAKFIINDLEQFNIDLSEIQELDAKKVISEKLKQAFDHHDGEFLVEDTSLYLDCMKGLPGPFIKWFMKTIGNEGLVKIAESFGNYNAQSKTIFGYAKSKDDISFFEGVIEGKIVKERGDQGFGYDPIFQPNGSDKTLAEMTPEEKNAMSMRRLALNKFREARIKK